MRRNDPIKGGLSRRVCARCGKPDPVVNLGFSECDDCFAITFEEEKESFRKYWTDPVSEWLERKSPKEGL